MLIDRQIWPLVGKPRSDVLLHLRPCGDDEILAEQFVVIADDLLKRVPFENSAVGVIDIGVEQRGHMHLRRTLLEQAIIADRLGNGTRGQHRMEFVAPAQQWELVEDILHNLALMRGALRVLRRSQVILNALDAFSGLRFHRSHRHLIRIHVMVEHFGFRRIRERIFRTLHLRLVESHGTSDFRILVRGHHVRVESEYIAIADTISDAVPVEAIAEYH